MDIARVQLSYGQSLEGGVEKMEELQMAMPDEESTWGTYRGYRIEASRVHSLALKCACPCTELYSYSAPIGLPVRDAVEATVRKHYRHGHTIKATTFESFIDRLDTDPNRQSFQIGKGYVRLNSAVFVMRSRCSRGCKEEIEVVAQDFSKLLEGMVTVIDKHIIEAGEPDDFNLKEPDDCEVTTASFMGCVIRARRVGNGFVVAALCPKCPPGVVILVRGIVWRRSVGGITTGIHGHFMANH